MMMMGLGSSQGFLRGCSVLGVTRRWYISCTWAENVAGEVNLGRASLEVRGRRGAAKPNYGGARPRHISSSRRHSLLGGTICRGCLIWVDILFLTIFLLLLQKSSLVAP